jgi:hypothetical protein
MRGSGSFAVPDVQQDHYIGVAENRIHAASSAGAINATDSGSLGALNYSDPLAILGAAPMPNEPWWQRISPSTLYVLLSCAVAIFFLGHELSIAGHLGFPDDDAWTQQVFAKHFLNHVAFEFNPNERVASPESPFWIVFLSVGVGLFHDSILTAKLLGAIFLFLVGYYTYRTLKSATFERLSALIGGALVITSSALAWSELSGLESCLAAALVMGAIWWHTAMHRDGWLHATVTGAIFALAAFTRPEAALAFLAVVLYSFFSGSHRFRNVLCMLIAFGLIIAPIAITNYEVGGTLLPPSVFAEISDHSVGIASRILTSWASIWIAIRDLYFQDNPLWLLTIITACISRWRRSLVQHDAADHAFSLSVVVLLTVPYFFSLLTANTNFASHEVSFLVAVYELAGVLSVAVLVRRELFRTVTPKRALLYAAGVLLIAGLILTLAFQDYAAAALLLVLLAAFAYIAFDHAGVGLMKSERPHEVFEADRLKIEYKFDENVFTLSEPAVKVLRGVLMIAYAWNIARLPHAAREFAEHVAIENKAKIAIAHTVASLTPPQDAVAAYQIGAVGYFGERRVVDLSGELDTTRGTNAIAEYKPKHLVIFSDDDSAVVISALARNLISLEVRSNATDNRAALYRIVSWDKMRWTKP